MYEYTRFTVRIGSQIFSKFSDLEYSYIRKSIPDNIFRNQSEPRVHVIFHCAHIPTNKTRAGGKIFEIKETYLHACFKLGTLKNEKTSNTEHLKLEHSKFDTHTNMLQYRVAIFTIDFSLNYSRVGSE